MKLSPINAFYTTMYNTSETIGWVFSCGYRDYSETQNITTLLFFIGKIAEYTLGYLLGFLFGIFAFGARSCMNLCDSSNNRDSYSNNIDPNTEKTLEKKNQVDTRTQTLLAEINPKIEEKIKNYKQESSDYLKYLELNCSLSAQTKIANNAVKGTNPGRCLSCGQTAYYNVCLIDVKHPIIPPEYTPDEKKRSEARSNIEKIQNEITHLPKKPPNAYISMCELEQMQDDLKNHKLFETLIEKVNSICKKHGIEFNQHQFILENCEDQNTRFKI